MSILKYVSPKITTIIKVLDPEQRDVKSYLDKVHPGIERLYKKLKNPKNIARINGKPIKYGESGSYLLEMLDIGDSLKKVL